MEPIKKWNDIKYKYKDGLVIGNGASIAVHQNFSYTSLYEQACELNLITSSLQEIFVKFNTKDFEAILRKLLHAQIVNKALSVNNDEIKKSYEECRNALIETIIKIHPKHDQVEFQLETIANFLENFKTVVSLNYDLILYWAIEKGNQYIKENIIKHCNRFKDCFIENSDEDKLFRQNWEFLKKPCLPCSDSTLVFYLHGNLSLANRTSNNFLEEQEVKITSPDSNHLDTIFEKWNSNHYSPLFICEGETAHKLISIKNSSYLNTVYYGVLRNIGESVAFYGVGFNSQDEHIIDWLKKNYQIKNIAISVHNNDQFFMEKTKKRILEVNEKIEIDFYDSQSSGCWNND